MHSSPRLTTRKREHITALVANLHPIYVVMFYVHSAMNALASDFLADLLNRRHPNRQLRSASLYLLSVPPSQTVTHGKRCFVEAAASLWLPDSTRTAKTLPQFRTLLKTHLFTVAFLLYADMNI